MQQALNERSPAAPTPPCVHVLHPGDIACAQRGERLETLLGSCVAIVLTDPRRTVGVMCHILYPGRQGKGAPPSTAYAHAALAAMYQRLQAKGITPRLCEAYVYGGGNMFPNLYRSASVGDGNASWALEVLQDEGIRVQHQDLGGSTYRRLGWTVGPGEPEVAAISVKE